MRLYLAQQGHPKLTEYRTRYRNSTGPVDIVVTELPFGTVAGITPPSAAVVDAAFNAGDPVALHWRSFHKLSRPARHFLAMRNHHRGEFGWLDLDEDKRIVRRVMPLYPRPAVATPMVQWHDNIDEEIAERLRLQGIDSDQRLRDIASCLRPAYWRLAHWLCKMDRYMTDPTAYDPELPSMTQHDQKRM